VVTLLLLSEQSRAQHGEVGVALKIASLCLLQHRDQDDFARRSLQHQKGAYCSPNGNLLELGLGLRKLQTLICTLSPVCTQRE